MCAGDGNLLECRGKINRVIFRKDEWLVARFVDEGGEKFKITGEFYKVNEGDRLTIWGQWKKHPRYGEQFEVERYERPEPDSIEAVQDYLSSGLIKGIGPALAERIVTHFGRAALDIAQKEPGRMAEVKGISPKKAQEIGKAIADTLVFQKVVSFFRPYGVTTKMALNIFKEFGGTAIEKTKENPYILTEVKLIGFHRADAIAQKMGIHDNSHYRVRAAVFYILQEAAEKEGHCYLPRHLLEERTIALLDCPDITSVEIEKAIQELVNNGEITIEEDCIYLSIYYNLEQKVAKRLKELVQTTSAPSKDILEKTLEVYEKNSGIVLAAEQKEAVFRFWETNFLILTGGPGTGKTQTTQAIIEVFKNIRKGEKAKICLAAPTGRASRRLSELTGYKAQTIHRLLGLGKSEGEAEPVRADLLVIDEFSMVDLFLMYKLVYALEKGTKVLLVGDVDQLPSVGPGNVLKDLIKGGIPVISLSRVFRQAAESQIVINAHQINRGKTNLQTGEDTFFYQTEDLGEVAETIRLLAVRYQKRYGSLDDFQVLSPMKKGPAGTLALNNLLQETFNPLKPGDMELNGERGTVFRTGDKVIQLVNDYEKGIYNGDLGKVAAIRKEESENFLLVDFTSSDCEIKEVRYDEHELENLGLAYAITVHKSQGSEYPVVVVPILTQHYVMLARNLVYTAITRAQEVVIFVGTRKAFTMAVKNNAVLKRYTKLGKRLDGRLSAHI